jgi:hypothetical protein
MQLSLIRAGCSVLFQQSRRILTSGGAISLDCRAISTDQRVSSSQLIAKWQGLLQPQHSGVHGQRSSSTDELPTEQLRQLCQDAIHGEHSSSAGSACMCTHLFAF